MQYLQQKGSKQLTIQIEIGKLKHYFNYQKTIGNLQHIPITHLKIQGVKRQQLYSIFSLEELDYIYQSYPSDCVPSIREKANKNRVERSLSSAEMMTNIQKRNKVILSLLIYQGITTTDLGNLRLEHIQLEQGIINIPATKKSNSRTLKLEAHQVLSFQDYILTARIQILQKAQKETEQFIVSTGTSHKILNLLQKLINQLKQDIPKLKNTKQLRASVITNWLKIHNLRKVQYMAGHRYVSSTENYKINDIATLQNDITQFSPNI
jgi:integrase/recombinase XerD